MQSHGADNSYSNYRHHGNITEKRENTSKKVKKQRKNMENHSAWSNASAELGSRKSVFGAETFR